MFDVPKDTEPGKNYYLEYNLFEENRAVYKARNDLNTQKYKIDLSSAFTVKNTVVVPVNKARMFHFFAANRKTVNEYFREQCHLRIHLLCENKEIAHCDFELNEFEKVTKRDIYKVFTGDNLPIMSWGVKVILHEIDN